MPRYRLILPPDPGMDVVASPTEEYESDAILAVGDVIEIRGRRWQVSSAPIEDPSELGETADVMVWPVGDA